MVTATANTAGAFIWDIFPLVIFLFIAITTIAGTWQIFVKMGKPGWKCVIPFYNEYTVFDAVWNTKAFWIMVAVSIAAGICSGVTQILFETNFNAACYATSALTLILLIASFVYQVRFCNKVSKSFGKGLGMTIALIVVPFFATLILGFGSAQYRSANK